MEVLVMKKSNENTSDIKKDERRICPKLTLKLKRRYDIPESYKSEPDGLMQKLVTDTLLSYVIEYQKEYKEKKMDSSIPIQICYKDFCGKMNYKLHWRSCKLYSLLWNISNTCVENNLPPITAVIINKGLKRPGDAFFECFYPDVQAKKYKEQFKICLENIIQCKEWENLREQLLSVYDK